MAEIRYNNQAGVLGANLTPVSAGTSQAIVGFFTEAPDFEALSGGDTITIVVFVPISGRPNASIYEIDEITAYNPSFPLNATITRGAQDGVNWPPATLDAGVALWACAPTIEDFNSGGVTSVFGRTGVVTAQSGDYSVGEITGAAPLASPAFTGTPTTPDATALSDNGQAANTKYVDTAVAVETSRAEGAEATLAIGIATAQSNAETFATSAASTAQSNAESFATSAAGTAQSNAEAASVPLAGGTMTGDLILNADPTVSLQAATKNYVDTHSGGTPPFSAIDLSTTHDPTLTGTEGTVELSNCDNTNLVTLADASLLSAGYSVTLKNANPFNPVPGGIGIVPNGAQTIDDVNIGGGAPCSFINPNASLTLVVDETGNWTTLGYSPASGYFQYGAISQAGPIFPSVGGAESISLDPLQGTADQFSATVLIPFLTYGAGQVCTFGGITTIKHAPTIFRPFTLECEIGVTNDDASQAISVLASVTIPAWAAPGDLILNRYTLQSGDFSVEGTPTGSDLSYDAGAGAVVSAAGGSYFIAASAVAIIV